MMAPLAAAGWAPSASAAPGEEGFHGEDMGPLVVEIPGRNKFAVKLLSTRSPCLGRVNLENEVATISLLGIVKIGARNRPAFKGRDFGYPFPVHVSPDDY